MYQLTGKSIIGFTRGVSDESPFNGVNPANGEVLEPAYYSASAEEVDFAARLANQAFVVYGRASGKQKAAFLRRIAENIEALGDALIERATQETGLATARIKTETGRTCSQLRLFAAMVEEGSWVDARIDRADPNRTPLPKAGVRSMLRPLGPVVVFCASNFPLAFSVAGGDTASALAAGNPVIVKAHHAHPGTAELVGLAVSNAVRSCELPEGVFSLIYGPGSKVGVQLVQHPLIKAGGFTGSRAGGQALMKLASTRPEPTPFYAEMSSVNPVFILPSALSERTEAIAQGLHASVTLGAGQFCTNPGLVFIPDQGSDQLIRRLGELMSASAPFVMLTAGISSAYRQGADALRQNPRVASITDPLKNEADSCAAGAAVFVTDAQSLVDDPSLSSEVFGPATLLVRYAKLKDLLEVAAKLEGQLTATIHASEEELNSCDDLLALLETKAGRLVFNGFPTGVEVGHAMVHGGPYPSTSDGRSTSVGTRAVRRFVRPVCYQDFAGAALPGELRDENPLNVWRMIDGENTKDQL